MPRIDPEEIGSRTEPDIAARVIRYDMGECLDHVDVDICGHLNLEYRAELVDRSLYLEIPYSMIFLPDDSFEFYLRGVYRRVTLLNSDAPLFDEVARRKLFSKSWMQRGREYRANRIEFRTEPRDDDYMEYLEDHATLLGDKYLPSYARSGIGEPNIGVRVDHMNMDIYPMVSTDVIGKTIVLDPVILHTGRYLRFKDYCIYHALCEIAATVGRDTDEPYVDPDILEDCLLRYPEAWKMDAACKLLGIRFSHDLDHLPLDDTTSMRLFKGKKAATYRPWSRQKASEACEALDGMVEKLNYLLVENHPFLGEGYHEGNSV